MKVASYIMTLAKERHRRREARGERSENMMNAIVMSIDRAPEIESMNGPRPALLVDLLFIQHARKYPVDQAAKFDSVLSHLAEKLQELFEDGSGWSSHLRRHPAGDAAYPHRLLKSLETEGSPISLAHTDRLPLSRLDQREPAHESGSTLFVTPYQYGSESGWEGRGWLPASIFDPPAQADEKNFFRHFDRPERNTI